MELALFGGKPARQKPYPPFSNIGQEEIDAVVEVMRTGVLSDYEGGNNEFFMGGNTVKAMEKEWAEYFGSAYAVAFNSATSGLYAAVGAAKAGPGDEVVTTPWTMTATATAILVNNAVPVFADIEPDTFTLCPGSAAKRITSRTKAIMPVHIYGHPADMDPIMDLAREHNLIVIEDVAQSAGAHYKGRVTGSIGHMGVHSLNAHKLIQCGEGGVVVTDDPELAKRLRLIRNHGEAVIATGMKVESLINMVGFNYRMNEIEAAISIQQLRKLESLQLLRTKLAEYLIEGLSQFKGLALPVPREGCEHTFYRFAVRLDPEQIPVTAKTFVKALNAEGLDWLADYIPLNQFPLYQQRIGWGDKGCPFSCPFYDGKPDYSMDGMPNVRHHLRYSLSTENVRPPLELSDMDMMIEGFGKVMSNLDRLAELEKSGN